MTWALTAGMWSHVILQSGVVLDRIKTRNRIWAELAAMFGNWCLFFLWAQLAAVTL